jgi:hypothetical protein
MENIYQNGKIYQIVSFSHPELVYYGSTIQKLCRRMQQHKIHYIKRMEKNINTSSEIIQYDDAKILLVELYPCNSKEELTKQEAFYIRNNKCVNKNIPDRAQKEWCDDNKDKIKKYCEDNKQKISERQKKNYKDNKDNILIRHKKYYENNKEEIKKRNRIKYLKNKEKLTLLNE